VATKSPPSHQELLHRVADLERQLSARTGVMRGFLWKHRPRFVGSNWTLRFFELQNGQLSHFRSERDEKPRMQFLVKGCSVTPTTVKRGRFYTFSLIHADLGEVYRLSSESAATAEQWARALQSAIRSLELPSANPTQTKATPPERMPPPQRVASKFNPFRYRASKRMHRVLQPSLLSSEAANQNYRGFLNLLVITFIVSNVRLIINNILKYGWLAFRSWDPAMFWSLPCLVCFTSLVCPIFATYGIERLAALNTITPPTAAFMQLASTSFCLVVPTWVISSSQAPLSIGGALLLLSTVLWMKLVSYAHTNADLRAIWKDKAGKESESESDLDSEVMSLGEGSYPENINFPNMLYFIAVPTLCYQLDYPQTPCIRKRWLAKRVLELFGCCALFLFMIEQYIVPTVVQLHDIHSNNTLGYNVGKIIEVLLKLSIPSLGTWLLMFFGLFHLWLNIVGELTCFGDRVFYLDWWNATTVEDYWKRWNLPVHNWLVRHVYVPSLRAGLSKASAGLVVFLVSAFFHEFLISVPCHLIRLWAFLGMMSQIPLVEITKIIDRRLEGSQLGNLIFWLSFCIFGQPAAILLYYYDFVGFRAQGSFGTA